MSAEQITKDNINHYLNEVAKEYKRRYGRSSCVEIVLVGGPLLWRNMISETHQTI